MFGRRANRRRVESRLARVKLPTLGAAWRAGCAPCSRCRSPPVVLYGAFKGVQLVLDQPVRNLVVEGTFQRVTPIQVEAAVADGLDAGFLTVDLGALRERVQQLDWVDRVNVGRRWPDTLIVRVTEHQAAARWGDNGLLNVRGELFTEQLAARVPRAAEPRRAARQRARRRAPLSCRARQARGSRAGARAAWSWTSAAHGGSCSAADKRSGSAGATSTSGSIDSSTSWRRRSRPSSSASSTWTCATRTASPSVGATDRRRISRPWPRSRSGG